jgi:hypothetical protein
VIIFRSKKVIFPAIITVVTAVTTTLISILLLSNVSLHETFSNFTHKLFGDKRIWLVPEMSIHNWSIESFLMSLRQGSMSFDFLISEQARFVALMVKALLLLILLIRVRNRRHGFEAGIALIIFCAVLTPVAPYYRVIFLVACVPIVVKFIFAYSVKWRWMSAIAVVYLTSVHPSLPVNDSAISWFQVAAWPILAGISLRIALSA